MSNKILNKVLYGKHIKENNEENDFGYLSLFDLKIIVPNYQRPYSWEKIHTTQLLNDLYEAIFSQNNSLDEYFLGNIMLNEKVSFVESEKKYEIIDGQQRITTYLLIFIWLRNKIIESKENIENYQEKINKYNEFFSKLVYSLIIHQNPDHEIFKKIVEISGSTSKNIEIIKNLKKCLDNFRENPKREAKYENDQIKIFNDNLKTINKFFESKIGNRYKMYEKYLDFLLNKVFFFASIIPHQYRTRSEILFNKINDRGLRLDEFDKLKILFMKDCLEHNDYSQIEENNGKWAELINFTDNNSLEPMIYYFSIIWNEKKLSKAQLLKTLPDYFEKNPNISRELVFDEILKLSKFYKKDAKDELNTDLKIIRSLFNRFGYYRYEIIYIFLLWKIPDSKKDRDQNISDKKTLKYICQILFNIFRANFLYIFVLEKTPGDFNKDIIIEIKNKIADIKSDKLDYVHLEEINNYVTNLFITKWKYYHEDFESAIKKITQIDDLTNSRLIYDNKNANKYITFFQWLERIQGHRFEDGSNCLINEYHLDHLIPKTRPKIELNGKEEFLYLIDKDDKKNIYISQNIWNKLYKSFRKIGIKDNKWPAKEFQSLVINSFVNLELKTPIDNQRKSNKAVSLNDLKNNLDKILQSDNRIEKIKNSVMKFFNPNKTEKFDELKEMKI